MTEVKKQRHHAQKTLLWISYDAATECYVVNPDAISLLQTINQPLAIVSIAGLYRTGKSYLINKLFNLQAKFRVSNTINSCTKGLWMHWPPIRGKDNHILVVDTEGIGAVDSGTSTHDSRVFSLAMLLSSMFIYNSTGSIDEQSIGTLNLVSNIAKQIRISADDKQENLEELGKLFPGFIWVVRDFALLLTDRSGRAISQREYLENSLQHKEGGSEDRNRTREILRGFFI